MLISADDCPHKAVVRRKGDRVNEKALISVRCSDLRIPDCCMAARALPAVRTCPDALKSGGDYSCACFAGRRARCRRCSTGLARLQREPRCAVSRGRAHAAAAWKRRRGTNGGMAHTSVQIICVEGGWRRRTEVAKGAV